MLMFSHNNQRCYAEEVEKLNGNELFLGNLDGYKIYQERSAIFNPNGFKAVPIAQGKFDCIVEFRNDEGFPEEMVVAENESMYNASKKGYDFSVENDNCLGYRLKEREV